MSERQQQESEEQHLILLLEVLLRVKRGQATQSDAYFLASELGVQRTLIEPNQPRKNHADIK